MSLDFVGNPIERLLLEIKEDGLENSPLRRYYSFYVGTIISVDGYESDGRVTLSIDGIGLKKHPIRAFLCGPYASRDSGFYTPPSIGDRCWVGLHHGDNQAAPLVYGYYWQKPKDSSTHIPAEFRDILKSGWKSKGGSSITFNDIASEKSARFAVGTQGDADTEATRHHELLLDKTTGSSKASLTTENGHSLEMRDEDDVGIEFASVYGHSIYLNDDLKTVTISSPQGFSIKIDENDQAISMRTSAGQFIDINDSAQQIQMYMQSLRATATISQMFEAAGVMTFTAAGIQQTSTAPNIVQGTSLNETYTGLVSRAVQGVYNLTVTGLATLTFIGGCTFNVTGILTLAGTGTTAISGLLANTTPGGVLLGSADQPPKRLATEEVVVYLASMVLSYNTHVHSGIGSPPSTQLAPPDVDTMTTTTLRGN